MPNRTPPVRVNRSRGIVLPSVLWITILTIVVAVNYASAVQLNTRTADNIKTSTVLKYDAISGIYIAIDRLLSVPASANSVYKLEFNGHTIYVTAKPENLKTDINSAGADELRRTFIDAGVEAEMSRNLAARVIDWRDRDHSSRFGGMEDEDYLRNGKDYGAKDDYIGDLVELLLMADIEQNLFANFSDHFTVYGNRTRGIFTLTAWIGSPDRERIHVTKAVVRVVRQGKRPYQILKWHHNHD